MTIQHFSHIVTPAEIDDIKSLGYQMSGLNGNEAAFINQHFPNFDIRLLLKQIDDLFNPICEQATEKCILFYPDTPSLQFYYVTDDYQDAELGLTFARKITLSSGEINIDNTFFRLPARARNKGIAKKVTAAALQQYLNMDARYIRVHASLTDGGFIWAKQHFTADLQEEMRIILDDAQSKLKPGEFEVAKRIYDNYYTKNIDGQSFPIVRWSGLPFMIPILRGSDWHGTIDLKNPLQLSNFMIYVYGQI